MEFNTEQMKLLTIIFVVMYEMALPILIVLGLIALGIYLIN